MGLTPSSRAKRRISLFALAVALAVAFAVAVAVAVAVVCSFLRRHPERSEGPL
jgi:ABC-type lipoprotein release transport system permease subunit